MFIIPFSSSAFHIFSSLQNSVDFPGGFVISAVDKDENGTQNAEVR